MTTIKIPQLKKKVLYSFQPAAVQGAALDRSSSGDPTVSCTTLITTNTHVKAGH